MSIVSSNKRVIFNGLDITATGYIYNTTASKNSEAGWVDTKYTDCFVQIGLATMAKSVRYRVEGRFSKGDRAASIKSGSIPGNNIDRFITIFGNTVNTLRVPQVRVGVGVATEIASPNDAGTHNLYCKLILTDTR